MQRKAAYTVTSADIGYYLKAELTASDCSGTHAAPLSSVAEKATNAPNMPSSTMSTTYSVQTVGAVSLPTGWTWSSSDSSKALTAGGTVTATAVYAGSDKGCYKNESVVVSITRAACTHASTEKRNAKSATCQAAGYTGDTYCKTCGAKTATGSAISATGNHSWGTGVVTKAATYTATGVRTYTCSVCGATKTETIEKVTCTHANTELRNASSETCAAAGYTGDTYCKDCGTKVKSGTAIATTGNHDWGDGTVTKEPTTAATGVRTYTCSVCGETKMEDIAKLEDSSSTDKDDSTATDDTATDNSDQTDDQTVTDDSTVTDDQTVTDDSSAADDSSTEDDTVVQTTSFVERMYTTALSREAEEAGREYWVEKLTSHELAGAGIAWGFICSDEFTERNLNDSDYVDTLYRTFFGREPDTDGKAYWMQKLSEGATRTAVLSGFVNSQEFSNLCDEFDIARGTMEEDGSSVYNQGVREFVERIYTKALNRDGETMGIEDWSYQIVKGTRSAEDVAKLFFASEEFANRKLNDSDYVETLYETFMGRASDEAGKADWVGKLADGSYTRDQVLEGFSKSAEFAAIMASYGL